MKRIEVEFSTGMLEELEGMLRQEDKDVINRCYVFIMILFSPQPDTRTNEVTLIK
jgi:hypothetical protein